MIDIDLFQDMNPKRRAFFVANTFNNRRSRLLGALGVSCITLLAGMSCSNYVAKTHYVFSDAVKVENTELQSNKGNAEVNKADVNRGAHRKAEKTKVIDSTSAIESNKASEGSCSEDFVVNGVITSGSKIVTALTIGNKSTTASNLNSQKYPKDVDSTYFLISHSNSDSMSEDPSLQTDKRFQFNLIEPASKQYLQTNKGCLLTFAY